MLNIRQFQDRSPSVADKLNYAELLEPGIVLCKDGSLMAGWHYLPLDSTSMTNDERNYLAARLNAELMALGNGWVSWHEAVRIEANHYPAASENHFPDPITRAIDEERRRQFESEGAHFETVYAFIVMYKPPSARISRATALFFDDGLKIRGSVGERILLWFKERLDGLQAGLSSICRVERMTTYEEVGLDGVEHIRDELVTFLQVCLSGQPSTVNLPRNARVYLDGVLGGSDLWGGVTPIYGGKFISVITVDGFPPDSYPGILDELNKLPLSYRWSTRFIYLDQPKAKAEAIKYRGRWGQQAVGIVSDVTGAEKKHQDRNAMTKVEEANQAIQSVDEGVLGFGYFSVNIVLLHKDRAIMEENARQILGLINDIGFIGRIEDVNVMDAWWGTLPGHALQNVRRPLLSTQNLAQLVPMSSEWPGLPYNPSPKFKPFSPPLCYGRTQGTTPFRINLHVEDVGHAIGVGGTGAGKSTLLSTLAASWLRYPGANVIAFDKGRSSRFLCDACGGTFYDLGTGEDSPGFAPLSHLEDQSDLVWAANWLEELYVLQNTMSLTPAQRYAIDMALRQLARAPKTSRTLTDFLLTVQDDVVRDGLRRYDIDALGRLLASPQDDIADSHFMVFEIEEFMTMGEKIVLPTLSYLFRRIERRLKGQPTLLLLDEAWVMLMHPVFREKIVEWLRTFRRANCAVVLFTQSLPDLFKSGIANILMESCPTLFLLPNPLATKEGTTAEPGPANYYRSLGLNDQEISLLAEAKRKKQYYYKSPLGSRLFELELGPIALSFVASSGKDELATLEKLKATHGEKWPLAWLEERNVPHDIILG